MPVQLSPRLPSVAVVEAAFMVVVGAGFTWAAEADSMEEVAGVSTAEEDLTSAVEAGFAGGPILHPWLVSQVRVLRLHLLNAKVDSS